MAKVMPLSDGELVELIKQSSRRNILQAELGTGALMLDAKDGEGNLINAWAVRSVLLMRGRAKAQRTMTPPDHQKIMPG